MGSDGLRKERRPAQRAKLLLAGLCGFTLVALWPRSEGFGLAGLVTGGPSGRQVCSIFCC